MPLLLSVPLTCHYHCHCHCHWLCLCLCFFLCLCLFLIIIIATAIAVAIVLVFVFVFVFIFVIIIITTFIIIVINLIFMIMTTVITITYHDNFPQVIFSHLAQQLQCFWVSLNLLVDNVVHKPFWFVAILRNKSNFSIHFSTECYSHQLSNRYHGNKLLTFGCLCQEKICVWWTLQ